MIVYLKPPQKIWKMMWLHIWKIQGNLTKTLREYNKVVSYKVSIQQWIHKPLFLNQSKWPKDEVMGQSGPKTWGKGWGKSHSNKRGNFPKRKSKCCLKGGGMNAG